ncbi:DUF1707 and FHA domain-containing protein [Streptomyces tsukubensis]|uniref:Peptide-binding protein n=1 Tax=Streptomyces tsukubensis TaxID=83656 RepID=A0A1V4ABB0_9ACTN|nr:DUF1707 and FHA domain-containing protein [Streptomyces tsukubensis]OON80705.1 peptide-binding protein [Streptomyces tsukubensis]QFR98083.1 FHA domain-containing protein [Streptomyces tsukubensis]
MRPVRPTDSAWSAGGARSTDRERDRVLKALQEGVAQGRLSQNTFVHRMELALAARHSDQLAPLVADLRSPGRLSRLALGAAGAVASVSDLSGQMRRAWRGGRLPKLLLPPPVLAAPLRIGRDPTNGLRLSHDTVSRVHAELSHHGGTWILRDLGSSNGTTVNGRRLVGATTVRDGDQVGFGRMMFRLATH